LIIRGENKEILQLLRNEELRIKVEFQLENLAQNPFIQNWRKAYKQFGEDKDRASHETLIRRVLKGSEIRHINKLVDIYNYISLKYRTPVGGEDLDKIEGNIYLKFANGSEKFVLLGSSEETHPDKGEVIYSDNEKVLCRKWNWRESDKTKLTEDTRNAFLVIDALPPLTEELVKVAVNELAELVKRYCNGMTTTFLLNDKNSEIEFQND
jgi:lysyl-tRNA synthetase class 2